MCDTTVAVWGPLSMRRDISKGGSLGWRSLLPAHRHHVRASADPRTDAGSRRNDSVCLCATPGQGRAPVSTVALASDRSRSPSKEPGRADGRAAGRRHPPPQPRPAVTTTTSSPRVLRARTWSIIASSPEPDACTVEDRTVLTSRPAADHVGAVDDEHTHATSVDELHPSSASTILAAHATPRSVHAAERRTTGPKC